MTPAEFAYHVRFMTRTTSATFTSADILALMKIRQEELAKDIIDTDEDIFVIPQLMDLELNVREYALPIDMLASFKRVEAKFDGTNWVKLTEIDINSLRDTVLSEPLITQNFGNGNCEAHFDLSRKSLYIFSGPIIAVTGGLCIWSNTYPAAVTDLTATTDMSIDPTTTSLGMPREMHEIWARGVIIDWKSSREIPIPLTERELSYKVDKTVAIKSLKPQNRDRKKIISVPYNDGSQY